MKLGTLLALLVVLVSLGAGACAVYLIRRKRIIPKPGDDFQILDE